MKTCPRCELPLSPEDYEGFPVFRCGQCRGHLVTATRMEAIKRLGVRTAAELEAEAAEYRGNAPRPVRCPSCRRPMNRSVLRFPGRLLTLDSCQPCSHIWFDGGELALLQQAYESTPRFADAQDMKQRAATLDDTPARKAVFEKNLARLPDRPNPVDEALTETAAEFVLPRSRTPFADLLRILNACMPGGHGCA